MDLDVSLRVRWRYESGAAKQTVGDLDQVAAKAARLGATDAGAKLGRDLKSAAGQAQGVSRDINDVERAANRLGQSSGADKLERSFKAARTPAHALSRDISDIEKASARLGAGRGLQAMDRELRDATRRAEDLERKLREVAQQAERTGARRHHGAGQEFGHEFVQSAGMFGGLRYGMSGASVGGMAAGGAVAAIGAGFAKAAHEAITFETAMAEVNKAVNDLSPEGLKEMERTILKASRATGIAKEEMAKLVAQAGFAGRPTQELARFAEFGAKAAVAFDMTAEEAGDALAKMGNVFKLSQPQIEDLGDAVNILGDSTAAKEKQIINFLYRAGASGQAIGMTAHQTAAFGAAIISTGKEAEVAATGFNALAVKLSNPQLIHDKEFGKGLRSIGLSVRQLKAEMRADPKAGMLDVLERVNKLPTGKRLEAATRLGGLEYGDDLVAAAGAVDQIRDALSKLQDQAARSGSVEKTFKIFDATTQRSINRAGSSMEAFATKIGQRFTPIIKDAAEWTAKLFDNMTKTIERKERVAAIATRLMRGKDLTKEDQDAIKADPKLKTDADAAAKATEDERKRRTDRGFFGTMWDMMGTDALSQARMPAGRGRRGLHDRMRGATARETAPPPPPPPPAHHLRDGGGSLRSGSRLRDTVPGTGKRADLADQARVQFAAYNDVVESSLDRTQRLVHRASLKMREDLDLGHGVQSAAFRFGGGGDGGARIINASAGGGGGGIGGGGGGPGRFGSLGRYGRGGSGGGGGASPGRDGVAKFSGGHGSELFDKKAPQVMARLMKDFDMSKEDAAAVLGNLGHESAGFKAFNEGGGGPGRGWAQWTDPGRKKRFFEYASANNLDPKSDEANYGFLRWELKNTHKDSITALKGAHGLRNKMVAFEGKFEGAGVKAYGSRMKYAERAMGMQPGDAPQDPAVPKDDGAPKDDKRLNGISPPNRSKGSVAEYEKNIAGDISDTSTYARKGEHITPKALVIHHTVEQGSAADIQKVFNKRGFPAQYIMDREGKITRALPEGTRGAHVLGGNEAGYRISNDNALGLEVIAKNDADVTPAQVEAARKFYKNLKAKYPTLKDAFGHGFLNPGRKEATEGKTIADAIRADENAPAQPAPDPAHAGREAAKGVPVAKRGFGAYLHKIEGGDEAKTKQADQPTPAHAKHADLPVPHRDRAASGPSARFADPQHMRQRFDLPIPRRDRAATTPFFPRFVDPKRMQLKNGGHNEPAAGVAAAGGKGGSNHIVQNFHGGFDAQIAARRAMLEQNRAIRRSQAGALHDIGRVG